MKFFTAFVLLGIAIGMAQSKTISDVLNVDAYYMKFSFSSEGETMAIEMTRNKPDWAMSYNENGVAPGYIYVDSKLFFYETGTNGGCVELNETETKEDRKSVV